MTKAECLRILGLADGADLDAVKQAYRKLAFTLHPDLNPGNPKASSDFQRLNEAYVVLTEMLSKGDGPKRSARRTQRPAANEETTDAMRRQARKAYDSARKRFGQSGPSGPAAQQAPPKPDSAAKSQDEVLGDLLRDPFARRVFEDIYSQIRKDATRVTRGGKRVAAASGNTVGAMGRMVQKLSGGLIDWVRRQADDEQTLRMPLAKIVPGARIRLQIHSGLSDKARIVEVTLPPGYTPGRAIRLKGLGKNIGGVRGDLYVRILPR